MYYYFVYGYLIYRSREYIDILKHLTKISWFLYGLISNRTEKNDSDTYQPYIEWVYIDDDEETIRN